MSDTEVRLPNKACLLVAVALLAAGCGGEGNGDGAGLETAERGTVAVVVDGDTFRLRDGRRIRLVQIDAPEERGDCYGRESTLVLLRLAPPGTSVTLVGDSRLDDADDGGRLLRYVESSGVNLNLRLVTVGAAAPYFFRNARGRYADELLAAARTARRERRGFWAACPGAELDPGLGSVTGTR